jgi:hypothetical protein
MRLVTNCSVGHTTVPFMSLSCPFCLPSHIVVADIPLSPSCPFCHPSNLFSLLFVVCCLMFVVCCLLFVVCCLLFATKQIILSERVQGAQNESGKKISAVGLGPHLEECERLKFNFEPDVLLALVNNSSNLSSHVCRSFQSRSTSHWLVQLEEYS